MDIVSALEPTGKANYDEEFAYAMLNGDDLYWYKDSGDTAGAICNVSFNDVLRDDWQPYHDKPEIRPEKAGELWLNNGRKWFTFLSSGLKPKGLGLELKIVDTLGVFGCGLEHMIHGQNGWTRICPPVPDENVERIIIENVKWGKGVNHISFPYIDINDGHDYGIFHDIRESNKPPMKMILEIPKENP